MLANLAPLPINHLASLGLESKIPQVILFEANERRVIKTQSGKRLGHGVGRDCGCTDPLGEGPPGVADSAFRNSAKHALARWVSGKMLMARGCDDNPDFWH